jgi:hypothetical protein
MAKRSGGDQGVVASYRRYRAAAQGWGDPGFEEFRRRLWPLKKKRESDWSEDDHAQVRALVAEGAGVALWDFVADAPGGPAVRALLGGVRPRPEPLGRAELDASLTDLLAQSAAAGWRPELYTEFAEYLDGRRQIDLEVGDCDGFITTYRASGAGYRARVRERLAEAAQAAAAARARAAPIEENGGA